MPEPGSLLGDHYVIQEILSGGMGEVFICEILDQKNPEAPPNEPQPPRRVALKSFKRRYFFNSAVRLSFIREASTWLRLAGLPHIMPVLGIEQIGDRPFIQMLEVVPGPSGERSVADLLRRGPLDPGLVLLYAFQLSLGLSWVGTRVPGLVHGDLKPANVLLVNGEAFLADFGLVSAASLGRNDSRLQGTWAYRAPELWADQSSPSVSSDVYAFGTMLFEMLVGRTPFVENTNDPEAWSLAHREQLPTAPGEYESNDLPAMLMKLALSCLEKDPSARPADFSEILQRVNKIGEEHDVIDHLMRMMRAHDLMSSMSELGNDLQGERVRGLLELGEPAQALAELDSINRDDYDAMLWLHRGTALSLLNRDDEALPCFEKALEGELTPDLRVSCEVEYALSLKRLERFDEARQILEELIPTAPENKLTMVIVNLSTVHLEQRKGEDAVHLLERFVRKTFDSAHAWANLGVAYVMVGRYQDAERAYGRALALAPNEGQVRVNLAALYMDHLGRFEEAWTSLDAAFDSGFESREWLVRTLACAVLLKRENDVEGLLQALHQNFEKTLGQSMLEEAQKKFDDLVKKYSGESTDVVAKNETAEPERAPATNNEVSSARMPFLNFRFYGSHDFTLDYYDLPDGPNFADRFLHEWRRAKRDPRIEVGGAALRGAPFYFTCCPSCGVHVLTNRDIGKQIRCRMCEHPSNTVPEQDERLVAIATSICDAMGITQPSGESLVHALLVQYADDVADDVIRAICERGGLEEADRDSMLAMYLWRDSLQRGAKPDMRWSVWTMEEINTTPWDRGATPARISAVVRELQSTAQKVQTLSMSLPSESTSEMRITIKELNKQQEEACRAAIREGRATGAEYCRLAHILRERGEFKEAERYARAAVALDDQSAEAWSALGLVLFKANDYENARAALEHSLDLHPNSIIEMRFLAICYENLGDPARANELHTRAAGLSGNEFPWQ